MSSAWYDATTAKGGGVAPLLRGRGPAQTVLPRRDLDERESSTLPFGFGGRLAMRYAHLERLSSGSLAAQQLRDPGMVDVGGGCPDAFPSSYAAPRLACHAGGYSAAQYAAQYTPPNYAAISSLAASWPRPGMHEWVNVPAEMWINEWLDEVIGA